MSETPTWLEAMRIGLLPTEFVHWAAQREGGLLDGPIQQEDYERLAADYRIATTPQGDADE